MFKKLKKILLKEESIFILSLIFIIILFNIHLPYYINMPGGTININDRIECSKCSNINGSLNMLYVTEYEATLPTYLLSFIMPDWDLEKISDQQVNNESAKEIYARNRLMLNTSVDNAIYTAYNEANAKIETKSKKTLVIATTTNNNLQIGDEIISVDEEKIEDVSQIKEIIKKHNIHDKLKMHILRDNKEKDVLVEIKKQKNEKVIGVIITTDYDYNLSPKINLKFKSQESGSSGGLMMALSIYTKISNKDIVNGRKIAGTGTIDMNGNIGAIDGVKYKIMGAVKNNIDIVLVPSDNYKEALKVKKDHNYKLKIVKVDTFKDAINYLQKN